MTTFIFTVLMLAFAYVCYIAVRGYCFVAMKVHRRISHEAMRTVIQWVWFLIFAAVGVPVAIFFPLWLSQAWSVFEVGPTSRSVLILLGCATLAGAVWLGWKSKEARHLAELMDVHR